MLKRRHKFNAVATELDGIRFDSKKEAQEYIDKAQELSDYNIISSLELLNYNIKCLKSKDSNLINKLDDFRRLLNLDS